MMFEWRIFWIASLALAVAAASAPALTLQTEVSPVGAGSVFPSSGNFVSGTQVTLIASANTGFRFDHWELDASGTASSIVVVMSADRAVRAVFVPAFRLTLSVEPPGAGSVSTNPAGPLFDAGSVATLVAGPTARYRFDHWKGSAGGNDNPLRVTVNSPMSITAVFVAQYKLTLDTPGMDSGVVTVLPVKDRYDAGETITLIATASAGWRFGGWGGDITSNDDPLVIALDRDLFVQAMFEPCPLCATCGAGAAPGLFAVMIGLIGIGGVWRKRPHRRRLNHE